MRSKLQIPEHPYTFVNKKGDTSSGVLPKLGESNAFAYWRSDGRWMCAKFARDRNMVRNRAAGVLPFKKQIPGQLFTFINRKTGQIDEGILPEKGKSNKFAVLGSNGSWGSRKFLLQRQESKRRAAGVPTRPRIAEGQIPGSIYTFKHKIYGEDTGILPSIYGEDNDFAYWRKEKTKSKGNWRSRKHHKLMHQARARGEGSEGLLGRMRVLHTASQHRDPRKGYKPFKNTPEEMLKEWELQQGKCSACGGPFGKHRAHYGHDHGTGESHGFMHASCNHAEGFVSSMSAEEFDNFVGWIKNKRLTHVL
jgi:Recombination endonuclease VII